MLGAPLIGAYVPCKTPTAAAAAAAAQDMLKPYRPHARSVLLWLGRALNKPTKTESPNPTAAYFATSSICILTAQYFTAPKLISTPVSIAAAVAATPCCTAPGLGWGLGEGDTSGEGEATGAGDGLTSCRLALLVTLVGGGVGVSETAPLMLLLVLLPEVGPGSLGGVVMLLLVPLPSPAAGSAGWGEVPVP
jgi:hypothetical protein